MDEPEPPQDRPICPEYLDEIAKAKWEQTVLHLEKMGLLSSADADAIEIYASAYSRYRSNECTVREFTEVVISPSNYPMLSPYSIAMNRKLEVMRRYQIELGLTPASRSRCAVQKKEDATGWGISSIRWPETTDQLLRRVGGL